MIGQGLGGDLRRSPAAGQGFVDGDRCHELIAATAAEEQKFIKVLGGE